ncbi:MAG: ABC transporter substrate-binding protein [Azoarcus sp.]|jgi:iron complex transport system substrate-binding protein|nr:ABC transporter substrate-binding protein [Azoarcus sp.]
MKRYLSCMVWLTLWLIAAPAFAERALTDMAGRSLRLPDHVRRVFAVGHCIPIVGAVAPDKLANNYRHATESTAARRFLSPLFYENKIIPSVGIMLSDEEIARMKPDLVIMETSAQALDRAGRMQDKLGVPVALIDPDFLKLKEAIGFLGEVLERREHAEKLKDFIVRHVDPIAPRARGIPAGERVRVYYAEGPDGLSTNPAGSSHTQVLDYVGGINVAQVHNQPGEGMNKVTLEQLYLWQPARILVWTPGAEQQTTFRAIVNDPLWQKLDAVAQGKVTQIPWLPYSWFDRPPGSNRVIGTPWLAQLLYPKVFDYDMTLLVQEYSRLFLHKELSAADARYLLDLATPGKPDARR